VFEANQTGAEADRERLDAHAAQLGDSEVAKFVDHNHDAYQNHEGDD
jgi:hypothetical protein